MPWKAITYVSSGLTLVAFIVAIGAWTYRRWLLQKERLIRQAPDQDRARLVQSALEFFEVETAALTKQQRYELAMRQVHARAIRFRTTAFIVVFIAVLASGVGMFALVMEKAGSFNLSPNPTGLYRVQVIVTDAENQPVHDAEVISVPEGKQRRTDAGLQIDIARLDVPEDKKLSIWATKESGIFRGYKEYILGNDYNPHVTVPLQRDISARLRGQVIDEDGRPIPGATLYLEGYLSEKQITTKDGFFDIPAYAAANEHVHLFVEKNGYQTWNDAIPAGGNSLAKILLMKKR